MSYVKTGKLLNRPIFIIPAAVVSVVALIAGTSVGIVNRLQAKQQLKHDTATTKIIKIHDNKYQLLQTFQNETRIENFNPRYFNRIEEIGDDIKLTGRGCRTTYIYGMSKEEYVELIDINDIIN